MVSCEQVCVVTVLHQKLLVIFYKVAIQPILTYGCSAINITDRSVKSLEKTQGILLKTALGLPKNRRNSSLFAVLGIEKIDQLIKRQQLTLLRNALQGNSKARTFYMGMMRMYNQGNIDQYPASLLSRCKRICNSELFSLHKYIFDNKYEMQCKRKLKSITRDGTVDSNCNLLRNYNHDSKQLVNLLLKPY